jgi:hypothetical protein
MKYLNRVNNQYTKVLQFNGQNCYLSSPGIDNYKQGAGVQFDFWMKPQKSNMRSGIFSVLDITYRVPFSVYIENDNLIASINNQYNISIKVGNYYNAWNHFAFGYNNVTGYANWYINGVHQTPVKIGNLNLLVPYKFLIGVFNYSNDYNPGILNLYSYFLGNLALVRWWSSYESQGVLANLCNSSFNEKTEGLFFQLELVNGLDSNSVVNSGNWFTPQYEGAPEFTINNNANWVEDVLPFTNLLQSQVLQIPNTPVYGLNASTGYSKNTLDYTIEWWMCCQEMGDRTFLKMPSTNYSLGYTISINSLGGFGFKIAFKNIIKTTKQIPWDYEWHHIVIRFTAQTNTLELICDGEELYSEFNPSGKGFFEVVNAGYQAGTFFIDGNLEMQFAELRFWDKGLLNSEIEEYKSSRLKPGHPNLTGYFPFSENSTNVLSNALGVGTLMAGYQFSGLKRVVPQIGQFSNSFLLNCFILNGNGSYLQFYDQTYPNYASFSLGIWVKRDRFDLSEFLFDSNTIKIYFTAGNNICINLGYNRIVEQNIPYKNSAWYYWAFTFDFKNNFACIYLNGELISKINIQPIVFSLGEFFIGAESDGSDKLKGAVTDVSLWDVALRQDDIIRISSKKLLGTESGLTHAYLFDNINNDVVKDLVSNLHLTGIKSGLVVASSSILMNMTGAKNQIIYAAKKEVNNQLIQTIQTQKNLMQQASNEHEIKFDKMVMMLKCGMQQKGLAGYYWIKDRNYLMPFQSNTERNNYQFPNWANEGYPSIDPIKQTISTVEPLNIRVAAKFPRESVHGFESPKTIKFPQNGFELIFLIRFDENDKEYQLLEFTSDNSANGFKVLLQADGKIQITYNSQNLIFPSIPKSKDWQIFKITSKWNTINIQILSLVQNNTFYTNKNSSNYNITINSPISIQMDEFFSTTQAYLGRFKNRNNTFSGQMAGIILRESSGDINLWHLCKNIFFGYNKPKIFGKSITAVWNLSPQSGGYPTLIQNINLFETIWNLDRSNYEEGPYKLQSYDKFGLEFVGNSSILTEEFKASNYVSNSFNDFDDSLGFSFMMQYPKLNTIANLFNFVDNSGNIKVSIVFNANNDLVITRGKQSITVPSDKYDTGWNKWDILYVSGENWFRVFLNYQEIVFVANPSFDILGTGKAIIGLSPSSNYGFNGKLSGFKMMHGGINNFRPNLYNDSSPQYFENWLRALDSINSTGTCHLCFPCNGLMSYDGGKSGITEIIHEKSIMYNLTYNLSCNLGLAVKFKSTDFSGKSKVQIFPGSAGVNVYTYLSFKASTQFDQLNNTFNFIFEGGPMCTINLFYKNYYTNPYNVCLNPEITFPKIQNSGNDYYLTQNSKVYFNNNILFDIKYIQEIDTNRPYSFVFNPIDKILCIVQDFNVIFVNTLVVKDQNNYKIWQTQSPQRVKNLNVIPGVKGFYLFSDVGSLFTFDLDFKIIMCVEKQGPIYEEVKELIIFNNQSIIKEKQLQALKAKQEKIKLMLRRLAIVRAQRLDMFEAAVRKSQLVDDRINNYLIQQNEIVKNKEAVERKKIAGQIATYKAKIAAEKAKQAQMLAEKMAAIAKHKAQIIEEQKEFVNLKQTMAIQTELSIKNFQKNAMTITTKANQIDSATSFLMNNIQLLTVNLTQQEWQIVDGQNNS